LKKAKKIIAVSLFVLFTLAASALPKLAVAWQQFSKAEQATITNYSITIKKVNHYTQFEKGVGAAKPAEPKNASLATPSTATNIANCRMLVTTNGTYFLSRDQLNTKLDANQPNPLNNTKKEVGLITPSIIILNGNSSVISHTMTRNPMLEKWK